MSEYSNQVCELCGQPMLIHVKMPEGDRMKCDNFDCDLWGLLGFDPVVIHSRWQKKQAMLQADKRDVPCPCCQKPTLVYAIQTYPAKYNMPDKKEVHCDNEECPMYMQTTTDIKRTWEDVKKSL